MDRPIVSIIIPVYNGAASLPRCLNSILAQPFRQWECIVVDDGSTDDTRTVCESFVAKDSRFCLIHKENGGVGSARNVGIDFAKGDKITFVDSDDEVLPPFLINGLIYDEDVISFSYESIDVSTNRVIGENDVLCCNSVLDKSKIFDILYSESHVRFNVLWGKLWKASIIKPFRFNTKLKISEDSLFVIQCMANCNSVRLLSEKGYRYYHAKNAINKKYAMSVEDAVIHINEYEKVTRMYPIPEKWVSYKFQIFLAACYKQMLINPDTFFDNSDMMSYFNKYRKYIHPHTVKLYDIYKKFNPILKPLFLLSFYINK